MAEDRDLIDLWRRGDAEAARALVTRHYPRLLNLFWRLTGDRNRSEELTQELFARFTRYVSTGGVPDSLPAWLHRSALNLWRDLARREIAARAKGITGGGGDEELARCRAPDEVEPAVMSGWQRDALRAAVLQLPAPQREALVLHYFEGLSYEETAGLQGVPVGTVRSRIYYAIRHLRSRLGPAGEGGEEPWTTSGSPN
ncbi:MAG TPA: RNA polymerase sigma factor [Symbiobacteriaceae bacterium]